MSDEILLRFTFFGISESSGEVPRNLRRVGLGFVRMRAHRHRLQSIWHSYRSSPSQEYVFPQRIDCSSWWWLRTNGRTHKSKQAKDKNAWGTKDGIEFAAAVDSEAAPRAIPCWIVSRRFVSAFAEGRTASSSPCALTTATANSTECIASSYHWGVAPLIASRQFFYVGVDPTTVPPVKILLYKRQRHALKTTQGSAGDVGIWQENHVVAHTTRQ
jgi:hypothetical protein